MEGESRISSGGFDLTNKTFQDSPTMEGQANHTSRTNIGNNLPEVQNITECPVLSEIGAADNLSYDDSNGVDRVVSSCVPICDLTMGPEIEVSHYPMPKKTMPDSSNPDAEKQNVSATQHSQTTNKQSSFDNNKSCKCSCHHTHLHHHHHTIVINGQPANELVGNPVHAAITTRNVRNSPRLSVLKTASCPAWADGAPKKDRPLHSRVLLNERNLQTIHVSGIHNNVNRNNNVENPNEDDEHCNHQIEQPGNYSYKSAIKAKRKCCGTLSKGMVALLVVLFVVILSLLSGLIYFLVQGKVPESQETDVPKVTTVLNQTSICGKYPAKYLSISSRTITNDNSLSNSHPPKNDNRINITQAARIIGGMRANIRQYPWQEFEMENPNSSNGPSKTNQKNTAPGELVDGSMVQGRIYGGRPTTAMRFPWQVYLHAASLWVELRGMTCGGSIILNDWVLTAAHCTDANPDPSLWTAYVGMSMIAKKTEPPAQSSKIIKIIQNPQYVNDFSYDYDVSLMKLETPLTFTPTVQPICIPHSTDEFEDGKKCYISGWGATTNTGQANAPKTLQHAQINIIGEETCTHEEWLGVLVTDRMICAGTHDGSKDACQGDSGGPLSCYDTTRKAWVLAGSVSWGIECGQPKQPGVYTKMTYFVDWIWTEIGKSEGWIEDNTPTSSGDGSTD
uniref:uncharacterized protein LOC120333641 isoform X1 n=1 Tax=Styela clava TaxID=7725 RepID=UPI001939B428|nr:uncharacterized protein LOC120333641 isoform X1 [Styela clava]